jgi:hypothetical protein
VYTSGLLGEENVPTTEAEGREGVRDVGALPILISFELLGVS